MIVAIIITVALYLIFVGIVWVGWSKTADGSTFSQVPVTTFSIVISVRNEAENILHLLEDLSKLEYPKHLFEIILVDDHSQDSTYELISNFQQNSIVSIRCIQLQIGTGKKSALSEGIGISKFEWIVTTDGDCRVGSNWLLDLSFVIDKNHPKMVVGPVLIEANNDLFQQMQQIEFCSLIASAAAGLNLGSPNMCNGANLAFEKLTFYDVGGYSAHDHVPSGDDELLMHSIWKAYPQKVVYNKSKSSIVSTPAADDFRIFTSQRRRWASKWEHYTNWRVKGLALFVFGIQVAFLGNFLCALIFNKLEIFGIAYLIKVFADAVLLLGVMKWFGKPFQWIAFLVLEIFYPLYVVIFALAGRSKSYNWKNRRLT